MVFERVGFAGRHRSDERVDLGFRQIGELFEQGGGHLFALPFFARPNPVDLVDRQPFVRPAGGVVDTVGTPFVPTSIARSWRAGAVKG
jgi:hypothetical protein